MSDDRYEIGAATADGWVALIVLQGTWRRVEGPWQARQASAHWAALEAVERATMLNLRDLDVARIVHVAQSSVVAVCCRADPDDGFAGLRLRLSEGLFTVVYGDPKGPPPCLLQAMELVLVHAEGGT